MDAYLMIYLGIHVVLLFIFIGILAYTSWQLIAIAKLILQDPDMSGADKLSSLMEVAPLYLPMLGSLGLFAGHMLHWPDAAYIAMIPLLVVVSIWLIHELRRPQAERVETLRQRHARTDARTIARLRSEGIYPEAGQLATDEQIKRLAQTKYAIYAYSLYRETPSS